MAARASYIKLDVQAFEIKGDDEVSIDAKFEIY